MTPKERAKDLVEKFQCIAIGKIQNDEEYIYLQRDSAKLAAQICVDEIDQHIQRSTPKDDPYMNLFAEEYWQEVKQYIINL